MLIVGISQPAPQILSQTDKWNRGKVAENKLPSC